MAALTAQTVAERLQDKGSRAAALDELEQHEGPHDRALAIAAAPVLTDIVTADADTQEVDAATFQRAALLRARLLADAFDDPPSVYGALFRDGRMATEFDAPSNVTALALQKPVEELDEDDALCFACQGAS